MNPSHLHRRRPLLLALAALCTGLAALPSAWAQDAAAYPDRPVKIVVPFPPGGAADVYARLVGQKLGEAWGGKQSVVIDNRAGAGGVIGTDVAAKAPADGSTFLMVTIGHAVNPFMYSKLPYDTRADLVPVGVVAMVPSVVVTGPALKGKGMQDLIAMAKAKPDDLQYASSGVGTTSHVGAALLESMSGAHMLHVPYKGAAPALQDVMADRVALSVDIITSSLPLVKSGKLNGVAITGAKRSPQLPDVPTVAETGLPGFEFVSWYMLLAPARTPAPILEKVNAALRQMAQAPDFRARVEGTGGEVASMTLKESNDYLNAEFTRWAKVVKERNIKAEQ
ncbi:tripartite tricarboxylate transporter substrate binding protein [Pseudorhodoferax sp.]|uniref:tripartite tricarboxylate transporter substrate binding protein n=1 Tax=Pseudorhodoferax sp. TaxID=1993553 RepID=UPI002DD62438|nr:tripartite tricarboxylate transporter substrate binding protein [Pseudorhodoferax sp.]